MSPTSPSDERYHAYLVRLWRDRLESPWRALVRDSANDEEQRFATVDELCLFLRRQTEGEQHSEETDQSVQEESALTRPSRHSGERR